MNANKQNSHNRLVKQKTINKYAWKSEKRDSNPIKILIKP